MLPKLANPGLPLPSQGDHDSSCGAHGPAEGPPDGGSGGPPLPEVVPRLPKLGIHLHLG